MIGLTALTLAKALFNAGDPCAEFYAQMATSILQESSSRSAFGHDVVSDAEAFVKQCSRLKL